MAVKCTNCGCRLGWLDDKYICNDENCSKIYCSICKSKYLSECLECESSFCKDHLTTHGCENSVKEKINVSELLTKLNDMDTNQLLMILIVCELDGKDKSVFNFLKDYCDKLSEK